jgi:hypothetical protein
MQGRLCKQTWLAVMKVGPISRPRGSARLVRLTLTAISRRPQFDTPFANRRRPTCARTKLARLPKVLGNFNRCDLQISPPGDLVPKAMQFSMMIAAQWHSKLIATLGTGLRLVASDAPR